VAGKCGVPNCRVCYPLPKVGEVAARAGVKAPAAEKPAEDKPRPKLMYTQMKAFPGCCGVSLLNGLTFGGSHTDEEWAAILKEFIRTNDGYGSGIDYAKMILAVTTRHQPQAERILVAAGFLPIAQSKQAHSGDEGEQTLWCHWKQPPYGNEKLTTGSFEPTQNPVVIPTLEDWKKKNK